MKAITYTEYGPPDVLQLTEVARPVPTDDEVLIILWLVIKGARTAPQAGQPSESPAIALQATPNPALRLTRLRLPPNGDC